MEPKLKIGINPTLLVIPNNNNIVILFAGFSIWFQSATKNVRLTSKTNIDDGIPSLLWSSYSLS